MSRYGYEIAFLLPYLVAVGLAVTGLARGELDRRCLWFLLPLAVLLLLLWGGLAFEAPPGGPAHPWAGRAIPFFMIAEFAACLGVTPLLLQGRSWLGTSALVAGGWSTLWLSFAVAMNISGDSL